MMLKRLNTIIPVMCNLVVLFIDNMMLYPHTSSNYSGFKFDVNHKCFGASLSNERPFFLELPHCANVEQSHGEICH